MNEQLLIKTISTIRTTKRMIMAHPDHQPDSEFWDRTDQLEELENELTELLNIN